MARGLQLHVNSRGAPVPQEWCAGRRGAAWVVVEMNGPDMLAQSRVSAQTLSNLPSLLALQGRSVVTSSHWTRCSRSRAWDARRLRPGSLIRASSQVRGRMQLGRVAIPRRQQRQRRSLPLRHHGPRPFPVVLSPLPLLQTEASWSPPPWTRSSSSCRPWSARGRA
jgi:hypothetical protein